jgi:hypothetical protein
VVWRADGRTGEPIAVLPSGGASSVFTTWPGGYQVRRTTRSKPPGRVTTRPMKAAITSNDASSPSPARRCHRSLTTLSLVIRPAGSTATTFASRSVGLTSSAGCEAIVPTGRNSNHEGSKEPPVRSHRVHRRKAAGHHDQVKLPQSVRDRALASERLPIRVWA